MLRSGCPIFTSARITARLFFTTAICAFVLHGAASRASAQEACCFPDGMCEELMPVDCANAGGTARGGGTMCDTVICPASDLCSSPALAIPDNDPTGTDDTIMVAGDETLADVDVYLRVDHTWIGDLIITLTHDNTMTTAVIYDRPGSPPGAGCSQNNVEIILDDDADVLIEDVCEPGAPTQFGIYIPAEALAVFNGEGIGGTWTLNISDNVGADTGTLIQWCLILKTDDDGDGVADEDDVCPGSDDTVDTDGDTVPDGCDACFGDDAAGDADGDGECDDFDDCPDDPNKMAPGACGCGTPDDDSDGDGVPDCFDGCPNDANKLEGGICGCGNADVDSDNDGWLDCLDNCPNDPNSDQADEDSDGTGDACTPPPAGQANPCAPQAMMMPMMVVGLMMFVQRRRRRRASGVRHRSASQVNRIGTMLLAGLFTVLVSSSSALAQPENDECSAAIGPLDVPSNTMGDTSMATLDMEFAMLPTCGTSITAPGIWYTVIGTGNSMTATTCDGGAITDYDTKLHVFCSCDAMICVGGNDDQLGGTVPECLVIANPSNRGSTVTWCSEPGAIYLILVSGFSANTGNFDLSISDDGMECGMPTVECDADGDGVTNEEDNCPDTPNPDQENNDGDEFGDACDNAPQDDNPNQADGDGDGVGDVADTCPGADDADDADGDGVCDALDDCLDDPNKTSPGACGCGNTDDDSDGDNVPDCFDQCPNDANKLTPGICGCGNGDVDSDGDGWLDCFDNCPDTPNGDQADDDSDGMGDACTPPPAGQDNPCAPMGPMTMMMTPMMLLALRRRR